MWAALGARARCTILHCCFLGGCFFFLGGGLGGANNVLGWPSYKIFSWTCCYAIHSSLALYLATRYQLSGGLLNVLGKARLTRYSLALLLSCTLLLHCTLGGYQLSGG